MITTQKESFKPKTNGNSQSLFHESISVIPRHVAIIMDGNGRWGKDRGLSRFEGHKAGADNIKRIIDSFAEYGVKCLTLYAFSTENWDRPKSEVKGLLRLLEHVVKHETENLHRKGIRIRHIGRLDRLSSTLQEVILQAIDLTKDNTRMTLSVAFDYGGRSEIVDAIQKIIRDRVPSQNITKELVDSYLYTTGLPEPDLIIRTAGEMRLSNFLIWQSAYSEYYSTPTCWPDFDELEVEKALVAYSRRQRKFGRLCPPENGDRG